MMVRTRFAPSPTGVMHLGNVRSALLSYVFAKHHNGQFLLRIEDTDAQRSQDALTQRLIQTLHWLGLDYDQGPEKPGDVGPYLQSLRTDIYQKYQQRFLEQKFLYRCFCTHERIEQLYADQALAKQPPRYDRHCHGLNDLQVAKNIAANQSFVWRFALNHLQPIVINDMARGSINFDLKHFSDPIISRSDGSFTFVFCNFVDDVEMKITHVFRGEEHLSNTAIQAGLYLAAEVAMPVFWHLPLICDQTGKKLSKRSGDFNIDDLKQAGFLPQAICNYLLLIGSSGQEEEIAPLEEMIKRLDFGSLRSQSSVCYDATKFRWVNGCWIARFSNEQIYRHLGEIMQLDLKPEQQQQLFAAFNLCKGQAKTLQELWHLTNFAVQAPNLAQALTGLPEDLQGCLQAFKLLVPVLLNALKEGAALPKNQIADNFKLLANQHGLKNGHFLPLIRLALSGELKGPSLQDLLEVLGHNNVARRLEDFMVHL